jgi:hypothetical protein
MIKLINILKEIIAEAKFEDIAVVPSKGIQRGTSEESAKSFDINIENTAVIRKMKFTPMGKAGSATAFSYEGPGGKAYTEFSWKDDTSQWDVWKNMNYLILTPKNYVHWYHGKMPGGSFKDDKTGQLNTGSTGTPLPDLTVEKFGYKVYKALLLEPSVGFIKSEKSSTPAVKKAVYANLMKDNDLAWISAGGTGGLDYDNIVIINPSYADKNKVKQQFEKENPNKKIYTSDNF